LFADFAPDWSTVSSRNYAAQDPSRAEAQRIFNAVLIDLFFLQLIDFCVIGRLVLRNTSLRSNTPSLRAQYCASHPAIMKHIVRMPRAIHQMFRE